MLRTLRAFGRLIARTAISFSRDRIMFLYSMDAPFQVWSHGLLALFDHHCHTLAAADAEGRQAQIGLSTSHFMEESHNDPRTRASDGVTQRDPTAMHIRLFQIQA